jgi:ATP-dependent RNA helicase RhlE
VNAHPLQSSASFGELGVAPGILEILSRRKIAHPTPIQHQAIPVAMQGKDIVGIAQTGTGKTWAFGIPMLQRLAQIGGRGLVIVPTRELAYQVEESLAPFTPLFKIRTTVFVGGASMERQIQSLRQNPRILIATPGRLNDHLEHRTVSLNEVKVLVLDEADQMLDMGFKPQIERILRHVPKQRQTMLFSATMPPEILKLASAHMQLPLRIEVAPAGTTVDKVEQELFIVRKEEKMRLLEKLLTEYTGTVLVFSRTKHGAKKMTRAIAAMGHSAAEIHSNRSLAQRRAALEGFKTGRHRILVATDIAARGIDVTGIQVVLNFDLPDDPSDYVHRIGRTARAGREGRAISFATPDQVSDIRSIERLIRTPLRRSPLPTLPPPRTPSAAVPHVPHGRTSYPRGRRPVPQGGSPQRRGGRRGGWRGRR